MNPTERLREDFPAFLAMIWRHLGLPRPTPLQKDIAAYLQGKDRRKVIEAFRGIGKSWITSAFVLWQLYRDPQVKVLVVSASKDRADAFTIFTKRLVSEVPFLQHLTPDPTRGDRDSNVAFDVRPSGAAHAPSVKSVGITGQITGSRADWVICDDVEVANNSESALQREKLLNRVAELGGAVLTPAAQAGESGGIVFLGTPQVEDSLYNKLPDAGYDIRVWPAEVPSDPERYLGRLAPIISGAPGTSTDPDRFDRFELAERKAEYGRAGYALQFMLDTTLEDVDRHPLKIGDLMVFDTDVDTAPDKLTWGSGPNQLIESLPLVGFPGDRWHRPAFIADKWAAYTGSLMYVDPSGRGRDETAYAVVKILHGQLYLRRWGGLGGGYDEATLVKLATIARDEKVNVVRVEDNFGDGMWLQLFAPVLRRVYVTKKGAGCALEDDHVSGAKEQRIINVLEPVLSGHRLVVDTAVVREDTRDKRGSGDHEAVLKTGFYQLTRLTRDRGSLKYDDRIDALAGAVRYWTDAMAADVDKAVQSEEDARLDKELDKIREHWFGKKSRANTWAGRDLIR